VSSGGQIVAALESLGKPYLALSALKQDRRLYLVGGTIRDILLGRTPTDFDFAVSGSGIEFGRQLAKKIRGKFVLLSEPDDQGRVVYRKTLTLDFNGFGDRTIEDDLARRDFTANAIALEVGGEQVEPDLIDPFQGQRAIQDRRLSPVSDQSLRLDPLRLLRAIRFALELEFEPDPTIFAQAAGLSLANVAAERVGYEVMRIMDCDRSVGYLRQLYRLDILAQLFPEAKPLLGDRELMGHSLRTYQKLEQLIHRRSFFDRYEAEQTAYFSGNPRQRALLKLAGLFHDLGKPETQFVNERDEVHFYGHDALGARYVEAIAGRRLRLARTDTRILKALVESHMRLHLLATGPELTERAIRRYFRDLTDQHYGLMLLTYADGYATAGVTAHLEATFARMIALKRQYDAAIRVKRLVTGDDLIALGLKPGPEFKTILGELEELQVEGKIATKEQGLEYVRALNPAAPTPA
jgi:tRNA nucleotidyltransferase/poly(A) polymerase